MAAAVAELDLEEIFLIYSIWEAKSREVPRLKRKLNPK